MDRSGIGADREARRARRERLPEDALDRLGIDAEGRLCWNGVPLATESACRATGLARAGRIVTLTTLAAAMLGAFSSLVQAVIAWLRWRAGLY